MTKPRTRPATPSLIHRLPWLAAPFVALGCLAAPIVLGGVLIRISGASMLDGLFGVYHNTPFQADTVALVYKLILSAPVLMLAFAIYFGVKRSDLSIHKRLAPLYVSLALILAAAVRMYTLYEW